MSDPGIDHPLKIRRGPVVKTSNLQVMSPTEGTFPALHEASDAQSLQLSRGSNTELAVQGMPKTFGPATMAGTPRLGATLSRKFHPCQ